jgi:HSP20 family protein
MSLSRRNSPFGELLSLRQAMDRLFEESYVRPRTGPWSGEGGQEPQALPLDVYTEGDDLVVQAALPGVRPEAVDITVAGETLTISGSNEQREERREGEYLVREVRRGSFSRTLALPADLQPEKATADFQDGMLTLRIPKAEQARPRQIRIPTSGRSAGPDTTGSDSSSTDDAANARNVSPEDATGSAGGHGEQHA